ncbi:hypothetical protein ACFHWD_03135 [Clostridium sp. MT-14]
MVERNGGKYFQSLKEVADYINKISIKNFKVGDRVQVFQLVEPSRYTNIGDTGIIVRVGNVSNIEYPISVDLDNGKKDYGFKEEELIHYE